MPLADSDYEKILNQDPGNAVFAEFADILRSRYDYNRALRVCFSGLSSNPTCTHGRLVLARLFYEQSYTNFAVRELKELKVQLPDSKALETILNKLAPDIAVEKVAFEYSEEKVTQSSEEAEQALAEGEFDLDDIELIDSDDDSS